MNKYRVIVNSVDIETLDASFLAYWQKLLENDYGYLDHIGLEKLAIKHNSSFMQYKLSSRWNREAQNDPMQKVSAVLSIRRNLGGKWEIELIENEWSEEIPDDLASYKPMVASDFWKSIFTDYVSFLEPSRSIGSDLANQNSQTSKRKRNPDLDIRAARFKKIKEKDPELTYKSVASMASSLFHKEELDHIEKEHPDWENLRQVSEASTRYAERWGTNYFEDYDVKNDFKRSQWDWIRGNK